MAEIIPKTPLTDFAALMDKIHNTPNVVPIKVITVSAFIG
jgi:hypothetical protein